MQTKWVYLTECMCHLAKLLHSLIIYRLLLYVVLHIYSICKIGKSSTSHSQQYIAYLNNLSSNLTQSDKGYSCEQCFMQNKTCIWPTACSFTDSGMHPAPKLSHIRQHSFVPLRRLKMDGGNGKRFFFFFFKTLRGLFNILQGAHYTSHWMTTQLPRSSFTPHNSKIPLVSDQANNIN